MPRVPSDYVPSLRLHRQSGQAIVTLSGRDYLLGPFGSPASKVRYHELVAQWLAGGRKPLGVIQPAPIIAAGPPTITVQHLVDAYKRHAADYYRKPDGTQTSEVHAVTVAADMVADLFGSKSVNDFGPTPLKEIRERMLKRSWVRKSVNKSVGRIRAMFRWGVENEMVSPTVLEGLRSVAPLKRGRSTASESTPVKPVPAAYINAIKPHVASAVWAVVQLQRLTGARGGELLPMRAVDIDTTGKLWTYRPSEHKTAHHEHDRLILFGPRAQAILKPFMQGRPLQACLFDPREAVAERKAAGATKGKPRHPGQKPNRKKTSRVVGDHYTNDTYRRAIQRACVLAGLPVQWHPHQLRHNFATEVRKRHGIETARIATGHKSVDVTEIYAERDLSVVEKIAREIG